jgi:hypothetical protein
MRNGKMLCKENGKGKIKKWKGKKGEKKKQQV